MLADEVTQIVLGDDVVVKIIQLSIERLESWGIEEIQAFELAFAVNSVTEYIKNATNQLTVPEGLTFTAVDMVCGEFLQKRLDTDNLEEFKVEQAIKTLKIGDTSTTFKDGQSSGIHVLISTLTGRKGDVLSHRKLKW